MPHDPARNVLFLARTTRELAQDRQHGVGEIEALLDGATAKLRAARRERTKPFVDRTPYTSWNAMMAGALLRAAAVLHDEWAREHALATLEAIRRSAGASVRLPHAPGVDGLLEDQVFTAAAAIDAWETTGDRALLQWSAAIMDATWEAHHEDGAGLRDIARGRAGTGLLDLGQTPIEDSPTPSPNGVAAEVCARLHAHTADDRWAARHRMLVETFAAVGPSLGLHGAAWCLGADWLQNAPAHLVVTGRPDDPVANSMHAASLAAGMPRRVITRLLPASDPGSLPQELLAMLRGDGPAGYLCVGTHCLTPAATLEEWNDRLRAVTRRPTG
jgi:hypothetical protein